MWGAQNSRRCAECFEMKPISKILGVFTISDLQQFRNMIMIVEHHGITFDAVLRYINDISKGPRRLTKSCPECGQTMRLYQVNTGSEDQVGRKYHTQWWCETCGYDEFSRKTFHEQAVRINKRGSQSDSTGSAYLIDSGARSPFRNICPHCQATMSLWRVNTPPGKANVHGYQSVWQCASCGYDEYSTRSLKEEATTLRRM